MLYKIKVELMDIEPLIWRELQVPSRTSLLRFHKILQHAMGWADSHLHLFDIGGKLYSEPSEDWDLEVMDSRKITLEKIFPEGIKFFVYEYDLGDSWRHKIKLLGTVPEEGEEKPACLAGARACPPEDCGGAPRYYNLLVALSDTDHEEHDTMLEWLGGPFDPTKFDVAPVDRGLKCLR